MILRNGKVLCGPVGKKDTPRVSVIKTPYSVIIDFDDASKQWRKNKIHLGEGVFRYKRLELVNHHHRLNIHSL